MGISDLAASVAFSEDVPTFYHKGGNGKQRNKDRMRQSRSDRKREALVIGWDGEGIDLRGPGKPQSYVLFGCSAEPNSPLIISAPDQCLGYHAIVDYICDVGSRNPGAIHVGYGFGYDQNMIIQAMPLEWKRRLYEGKAVRFYEKPNKRGATYRVKINWRKRIEVTRSRPNGEKTTVRIDDIASFFGAAFTEAYRTIVRTAANQTVVSGKAARGHNRFENLPEILTYWQAEIVALAELGNTFRNIMYDAGFFLTDWYGPGAIANYLRRTEGLALHEWGAKEDNIPAGLHEAAKSAFYGGRFEQFLVGRIEGPIYSLDINSAYPAAFCDIPSLREGGFWHHVETPSDSHCFGVYRLRYTDADNVNSRGIPRRCAEVQPLPYRDYNGQISYPALTEGWYWRPEMEAVSDCYPGKVEIYEGWEWRPATDEYPWRDVMHRMFAIRKELKRCKDPTQLAYKLAINSLYGKMAQRVGWNKETNTPPNSHSLAVAGYITSHCRAALLRVMNQLPLGSLIAVETDGIYFTNVRPDTLVLSNGTGSELGQWELEQYDEMMYVQNGVYLARKSSEWVKAKSRGFSAMLVTPESITSFLQSLGPRSEWLPLKMPPVSNFIGIGLALQLARNSRGAVNPSKARAVHCQWVRQDREIDASGRGKRIHIPAFCPACDAGTNAYERPHTLFTNHGTTGSALAFVLSGGESEPPRWNPVSGSYRLPWETATVENWRDIAEAEEESIEMELEYVSVCD